MGSHDVVIGILAIIGIFFVPFVMVILIVWFRNDARKKRYQFQADLAAKALEKGQTVSADLFTELESKRNPLNTGIICIAVGIGISLFIWLAQGTVPEASKAYQAGYQIGRAASFGIIPFLIGVAYVLIHFIEKGKTANENAK